MSDPGQYFGQRPLGSAVQPCPLAEQPSPVHWIEILLSGEDGNPVPWEAYAVELPDGELVTGYLDGNGRARIENIATAGECQVRFPLLDQDAWERA